MQKFMRWRVLVFLVFLAAFSARSACAAEEAVALPSRFDNTPKGGPPPRPAPIRISAQNRSRRDFPFGAAKPVIPFRAGLLTDVELEPGERVNNIFISDPKRWSMSAAWSGQLEEGPDGLADELVTHVLLRTSFPGLKADLIIHTDRRTYTMEFHSTLDGPHISYIGFDYAPQKRTGIMESEPIPEGPWRDLLLTYSIISDDKAPGEPAAKRQDLVEGPEVNFRYSIKPAGANTTKIVWSPISVYDAGGATYIVLPKEKRKDQKTLPAPGAHTLLVTRNNKRLPARYEVVRDDLYVVNSLFDEAFLIFEGKEVVIRRLTGSGR